MRTMLLGVFAVFAGGALAAGPRASSSAIHEQYLQERAQCDSSTLVDRTACRREAGAAQFEARRGTLAADDSSDFERNRLARCDLHKNAEERDYCIRRMRGEGTTTGSVEGGGILRELIVVVPAEETAAVAP